MTSIEFHRARTPNENDLYEVKATNHVSYVGNIFFEEVEEGVYQESESVMDDNHEVDDFILDSAKSLIREEDAKEVRNRDGDTVVKLKIGEEYKNHE